MKSCIAFEGKPGRHVTCAVYHAIGQQAQKGDNQPAERGKFIRMVLYGFPDFLRQDNGKFLHDQTEQPSGQTTDNTAESDGRNVRQERQGFIGIPEISVVADNRK